MPAVFICVSERKGLQLEAKEGVSDVPGRTQHCSVQAAEQ